MESIQEINEQKKEYLRSYRAAVKREERILEDIQELRASKAFPAAISYDGMPKGSNQSDLSDYIAILDRMIENLKAERLENYRPKKRFRSFKKKDAPIVPKEPAVAYLESRKIPGDIARKYEITTQTAHDNILVFPFYDEKGVLQFIKYRKTDFDKSKDRNKEWCERDCKPILFGMKQCNDRFDRLIITEQQLRFA